MSKLASMRDAVSEHVSDGSSVVMGTCLESMIPFAAGHELIRQERRELTLIGPISDILFDQLIGAGCVARIRAAWVGNVSAGLGHNYRRAAERGTPRPIEVEDHSNLSIALGLHAAALGLPFLPTRSLLGSDIAAGSDAFADLRDPWSEDRLLAVRAIRPDVAIVGAQRADENGNAHAWGNLGVTQDAVMAADRVILLAEEIVTGDVIRSDPGRVLVPGFRVSAIVHEPGACHPSPVQGCYRRDHAAFAEYHEATRDEEGFEAWLREWILEVPDRAAYLERLGPRWDALRDLHEARAAVTDYGW
ncbi:MAG TPA: CoA-transferase [Actinomycetota bacterium]